MCEDLSSEELLELKDILLKRDFNNLKGSLDTINIILESSYKNVDELYENRSELYENEDVYNILKNNVFAGRVSIKYWTINGLNNTETEEIQDLCEVIESWEFYNKNILGSLNIECIDTPTPYTCIKLEDMVYLMRLIVPSGNKKYDNGVEDRKSRQHKNVVTIIDLNKGFLEVRAESKISKSVMEKLKFNLGISGISNIAILRYFDNSIETFKNSFENAKFINIKSIPSFDSELTQDEIDTLVDTLEVLDDFFITKDYNSLVESLNELEIEANEIGFIPLLLAGLSNIGISTKHTDVNDITNQPMYKLIEPYLDHQKGHLFITEADSGNTYSLQIGMKTNSIVYKKDITNETFIKTVRNKLLNIEEVEVLNENV